MTGEIHVPGPDHLTVIAETVLDTLESNRRPMTEDPQMTGDLVKATEMTEEIPTLPDLVHLLMTEGHLLLMVETGEMTEGMTEEMIGEMIEGMTEENLNPTEENPTEIAEDPPITESTWSMKM